MPLPQGARELEKLEEERASVIEEEEKDRERELWEEELRLDTGDELAERLEREEDKEERLEEALLVRDDELLEPPDEALEREEDKEWLEELEALEEALGTLEWVLERELAEEALLWITMDDAEETGESAEELWELRPEVVEDPWELTPETAEDP